MRVPARYLPTVNRLLRPLSRFVARLSRLQVTLLSLALTMIIGFIDYLGGLEISFLAFHAIPITIVAWFVGPASAFAVAVFSLLLWMAGDLAAGAHYSSWIVPVINCGLRMIFYAFFVIAIDRLSQLQRSLETLAGERAALLAQEIAERERLEREMLLVSEREQRRIGQDLHDGLCQHLTGTALAGHALAERLTAHDFDEAASARKIVDLVEEGIALARGMAKGLYPVEMTSDGLMQALEEFAATTSELFGVHCRFECQYPVLIHSAATATHLYRIAQEAVSNAIKHGRATDIVVLLEESEQGLRLAIIDNGSGLPAPLPKQDGLGLRIMADRAKMIGGRFTVGRGKASGAELICLIPAA